MTVSNAPDGGPPDIGNWAAGDDASMALKSVAQAMLRTAAPTAAAAAVSTASALAQAINGSPAAASADSADPLPADPAGAGQRAFGAALLITPGLLPTAGRAAAAAAAAGKANAEPTDGDAPMLASADRLAALAGSPVGKALADTIGLASATNTARKTDAQTGTATADTGLLTPALAERNSGTLGDTIASTTMSDGVALVAPGAGPLATLTKAAALHEARIATAVTDPGFAPALGATLTLLARDGVEQARLNLHPAEMGPITVQISVDGTAARVDFHAEVAATRAALEAALPALASALQDAGLSLSGGGVFQASASAQSGPPSSQAQAGGGGQGSQDQPRRGMLPNVGFDLNTEPLPSIARAPRGIVDLVA